MYIYIYIHNDLHLFPFRTSKTRKTVEEAKRVPKSFTAMDGIEQGHRRGSSIRCLRGEFVVLRQRLYTASCARARALAPTFTSTYFPTL